MDIFFDDKYKKIPKILKNIFCFFIYKFNIILLRNIEDRIICILPYRREKLSNRKLGKIADKIYKCFKQETFLFLFSSNIKYQEQLKIALGKYNTDNIIWIEGKWLFSHLIFMLLEYISKLKQVEIKEQKIDILVNELTDVTYYEIKKLACKAKRLKIITPQIYKFRNIEKELYEKNGIAIELSNNMKKSLSKSNLIINVDFTNDKFNKYKINKNAIIIQINEKVKVDAISFNGINILNCNVHLPNQILERIINNKLLKDFPTNILYESYLYRKDKPENIIKQIINDEVKIEYLIGNKGRINELEFKNLNQFT